MSNISAKTVLHTIPELGLEENALITLEVNVPYYVWVELLTHKRFARNASSNRALSVSKNIEILGHYDPDFFYRKGKGMQSGQQVEPFSPLDKSCMEIWDKVWEFCSESARKLEEMGIAKEQASRVLPTFKMMKGLVTGTFDAWKKFLELRVNSKADIAMQDFAKNVRICIENPVESKYKISKIHMPFWEANYYTDNSLFIASGRIARVSYLSYNSEEEADHLLGKRLIDDKHFSPIEHIAKWECDPLESAVCSKIEDYGSDYGWTNLRSYYEYNNSLENFFNKE